MYFSSQRKMRWAQNVATHWNKQRDPKFWL